MAFGAGKRRRAFAQQKYEAEASGWGLAPGAETAMYVNLRSSGVPEDTAFEAVMGARAQEAWQPPGEVDFIPTDYIPIAFDDEPAYDYPLAPTAGPIEVAGGGEAFDVDGQLVEILFRDIETGGPVTPATAIKALIGLIMAHPRILDAIAAAFKLVIRAPGQKAREMTPLSIACLLQELPAAHRKALCQFEGGLSSPIALSKEAQAVFLVLVLADAININPEYDIQEIVFNELVA